MSMGGVATLSFGCPRSHSKRLTSCRSNTATSVSRMTDSAPSSATAFAKAGKRSVNSLPWRLMSWAEAYLVGEHAIAVHLLFVDPAGAVEGPGHERRLHDGYGGQGHESSIARHATGCAAGEG